MLGGYVMLTQVFVKNYKAFDRKTILLDQHNMIIGENDAGKSTLLSALNIFFNNISVILNNAFY